MVARGGRPGQVGDIAIWAVPFRLVGGRLHHVATDYQLYFGEGRDPVTALYVWQGGLGIWGAIALGAVGAAIGATGRGQVPAARRRARTRHDRPGDRPLGQLDGQGCSAGRPRCRGGWRSTPCTGRWATSSSRRSTRRTSTSSSGTWRWPRW